MSVYNGQRYLCAAVDSILAQTFTDFEFIIVNDGSTDRTQGILESYEDERLIIIEQENRGLTASLNRAIKRAKGEYIARMDADDISLPTRLEAQVNFLDEHPQIGLVGTFYAEFTENGEVIRTVSLPTEGWRIKRSLSSVRSANPFCHGAVMFRRECIEQVGDYREEFQRSQDYDLWLRIAEHHGMANLEEPLYMWRLNPESVSMQSEEQVLYHQLALKCARRRRAGQPERLEELADEVARRLMKRRPPVWEEHRRQARYHYLWGLCLLAGKRPAEAKGQFVEAVKAFPLSVRAWFCLLLTLSGETSTNAIVALIRRVIRSLRQMAPLFKGLRRASPLHTGYIEGDEATD